MTMKFEELDEATRVHMLNEFDEEEAKDNPYRPKALSVVGSIEFSGIIRQAIRFGNEETLITSLLCSLYWHPTELYTRNGITRERRVNMQQAAERLGLTEFNTWYVRGLSKKLIIKGIVHCQVYRASEPKWEPRECCEYEGRVLPVVEIYNGHRVKYWPEPGKPYAMSIPFGPGCHHTIRRVSQVLNLVK